jgi:hypothetical protein
LAWNIEIDLGIEDRQIADPILQHLVATLGSRFVLGKSGLLALCRRTIGSNAKFLGFLATPLWPHHKNSSTLF